VLAGANLEPELEDAEQRQFLQFQGTLRMLARLRRVPFRSPERLRVAVNSPSRGTAHWNSPG
jgi:hypothetical protein